MGDQGVDMKPGTHHRYSARVGEALVRAAELHADQTRRRTAIPYLSHLVAVAALVIEDGGGEDEVIAGLLHDAVEDQGGMATAESIRKQFGDAVINMVLECSDTPPAPGQHKAPWIDRAHHHLAVMATMSEKALRVTAADKLHNAQSTLFDLNTTGPDVWERFRAGREGFLWYYTQMHKILEVRLPGSRSGARLGEVLKLLALVVAE